MWLLVPDPCRIENEIKMGVQSSLPEHVFEISGPVRDDTEAQPPLMHGAKHLVDLVVDAPSDRCRKTAVHEFRLLRILRTARAHGEQRVVVSRPKLVDRGL